MGGSEYQAKVLIEFLLEHYDVDIAYLTTRTNPDFHARRATASFPSRTPRHSPVRLVFRRVPAVRALRRSGPTPFCRSSAARTRVSPRSTRSCTAAA